MFKLTLVDGYCGLQLKESMNMKKKLESISILLMIIFGAFGFVNVRLFPIVKATYVDGDIKQDTIWPLLESPFVVSKNIIVYANATLTIEPGVKVRFGGVFYLIVNGGLYANGTEKSIIFTSNKKTPSTNDWGTILVNGTGKATLVGCSIVYAENGILIENAEVQVKNTEVRFCQNGINITDGMAIIQDSVIAENTKNGISIVGNDQVSVKNTTVMANSNGILLRGNLTSNVDISQNKISANTVNGILVQASGLSNVNITHNFVSSNNVGIRISSLSSMYLTNNSISYNQVGVQYDDGNHTIHYNDFYGNDMGMDINPSINGTVNAEYNYWGDTSGPYHESLNPDGKGDKVGGNGVNLDFIFFLTKNFSLLNSKPTAKILTDKVVVLPSVTVMLFATHSFDVDGRVDRYFLDFGDGTNSDWNLTSVFIHSYTAIGDYIVSLRVMDDYGAISEFTYVTISVQNVPQLQASLSLNDLIVQEGDQIQATVQVKDEGTQLPIENANVTLFLMVGREIEVFQYSGFTNASGHLIIPIFAPDITEKTDVRIVARASQDGYADGSDYDYIEVSPLLSVEIITNPNIIESEETAQVVVQVRSNLQPVTNASVTISTSEGMIYNETGTTDSNGAFSTIFVAPQTTTLLDITITAIVIKDVYTSATGETVITVEPKTLSVQITANGTQTISEGKIELTVHVEYETLSIAEADITINAESGNFTVATEITDANGNAKFVFTAPLVDEEKDIMITAKAAKTGYANGTGQIDIIVLPKTLSVNIDAPLVESEKSAIITVNVECKEDSTPVEGATVAISSNEGNFSALTGTTDSNGNCVFTFNAPKTEVTIEVNATVTVVKSGFATGGNQTVITVIPQQAGQDGWSITTLLLIIIPVVIVVIVVVLIKMKVIVVSAGEEEG